MRKRLIGRDLFKFGACPTKKWTAGAREPNAVHAFGVFAQQALEDGTMF